MNYSVIKIVTEINEYRYIHTYTNRLNIYKPYAIEKSSTFLKLFNGQYRRLKCMKNDADERGHKTYVINYI